VEVESAVGVRFGDLLPDIFVGAGADEVSELVVFVGGEGGEGRLRV